MKTLFIEAYKPISQIDLVGLPSRFTLAYSIQYKPMAEKLKKQLGKRVVKNIQVLGCSKLKSDFPIVLLSDGVFHAINLALQNSELYVLQGNKIIRFDQVNSIKAKKKAALSRFYSSDNVGLIVSIKPGQENLELALKTKSRLKNKKLYIFLTNNLNLSELENFSLPIYINTACPGLSYDSSRIVNYEDIIL